MCRKCLRGLIYSPLTHSANSISDFAKSQFNSAESSIPQTRSDIYTWHTYSLTSQSFLGYKGDRIRYTPHAYFFFFFRMGMRNGLAKTCVEWDRHDVSSPHTSFTAAKIRTTREAEYLLCVVEPLFIQSSPICIKIYIALIEYNNTFIYFLTYPV